MHKYIDIACFAVVDLCYCLLQTALTSVNSTDRRYTFINESTMPMVDNDGTLNKNKT